MKEEREKYLTNKFPLMYTKDQIDGRETPYSLFGFECGDGWFRIIYWLSKYVQNYIDENNKYAEKFPNQYKFIPQVKVVQVKEKFGGLRFYYSGGDDKIGEVISFVESISYSICETTGKTENIGYNTKGWIKTKNVSLRNNNEDFEFIDDEELRKLNLEN